MIEKVRKYIQNISDLHNGGTIVVGVSGGADSVCLLCVLQIICAGTDIKVYAVHINHNIRSEAAADQDFVESLCKARGIPCRCYSYDVERYAKEQKLSVEEAGRILRYEAFKETLSKCGGGVIAVAHTMDDNAETILLNLFRGSGMKGLSGIPAKRENIIRPLLGVRRREIEDWLKTEGIGWREDSTNDSDDYTRNRIRHKIIPVAEREINDRAVKHMNRTATDLAMAEDYIAGQIDMIWKDCIKEQAEGILLLYTPVTKLHPYMRRRILYRAMERTANTAKDIGSVHVDRLEQLFSMQCGKQADLAYGIVAERVYEGVALHREAAHRIVMEEKNEPVSLVIPGNTFIAGYGTFQTRIIDYKEEYMQSCKQDCGRNCGENCAPVNFAKFPKDAYTKWFDYDKIKGNVCIRTRMEGDYISINTAGNTQKLKSYLINEKVPKNRRDTLLLVADGSHIMWIPGYRSSHEYYINNETKKILEIQYTEVG